MYVIFISVLYMEYRHVILDIRSSILQSLSWCCRRFRWNRARLCSIMQKHTASCCKEILQRQCFKLLYNTTQYLHALQRFMFACAVKWLHHGLGESSPMGSSSGTMQAAKILCPAACAAQIITHMYYPWYTSKTLKTENKTRKLYSMNHRAAGIAQM